MGKFDFLDKLGNSKKDFSVLNVEKDVNEKILYLEILENRHLMQKDFKKQLIDLYLNKKITESKFFENVQKSIRVLETAEFKILSVDEDMFKLKNDVPEYVGEIDRMPNDNTKPQPNRGKVSYVLCMHLFENLKYRILTLKEINALSDILDFNFLKVFNVQQTKVPEE
jgi:hypothetical protein